MKTRAARRLRFLLAGFATIAAGAWLGLGCGDSADDEPVQSPAQDAASDGRAIDGAAAVDAGADARVDARADASPIGPSDASADGPSDASLDGLTDGSADGSADAADASDASLPANTVVALAGGAESFCILRADGKVKCWGSGNFLGLEVAFPDNRGDAPGEMGSALPFVNLGAGAAATALFGGSYTYTRCAIVQSGGLRCFGANGNGELGGDLAPAAQPYRGDAPGEMGSAIPDINLGTDRTAVFVSTTNAHTCAVLDNGKLKCWGNNGDGQLGLVANDARGDGPSEMGDNLPFVDFGSGRTAKMVHVANARTCVITDQSAVRCWGSGTDGQLGRGSTASVGGAGTAMGDALADIDLGPGRTALAITGGLTFACALLDDHSVKCWGYNQFGELGLEDQKSRGGKAGEMGSALPVVNLGTGRTAKAIASGAEHTCAILDDDSLKCWGKSSAGQLGYGDSNDRGDNANEMGDKLPAVNLGTGRTVKAIAALASGTCALLDDGALKCWGANSYGSLGMGSTKIIGDGPGEMGDQLPAVDLGP